MKVLHIHGASILDQSFVLDHPDFPEIIWNVTRMGKDAFSGRFGPAMEIAFSAVTDTQPKNDFTNLERKKVLHFIALADTPVVHNNKTYKLIDLPAMAVVLQNPKGFLHAIPVDGNHRVKARHIMGLPTFNQFVVPPELEREYRVTMRTIG